MPIQLKSDKKGEGCRLRRRPATHAPDLPDLGYNGRGRGSHDHQRQFPLDADGCGDLLWNELEESYKQVKLSEESIATAEENVRLNTDYYKAGTVTLSDLLDAQSLLQQSRDQYTGDYTAYLIKRTEYLQATGR